MNIWLKNNSALVKSVDKTLLVLSILLIIFYIWGFFVNNSFKEIADALYLFLWLAFTIEYLIKLTLAKKKINYILNDVLAIFIIIFPFLRPLRLFPASRFSLIFFTDQLNERISWFKKYRILEVLLFAILFVILAADLFLVFEKGPNTTIKTFSDAVWFSMASVATVGYGDVYPKSVAGRILATMLIIFGVSIFGIVTAKIASLFVDKEVEKDLKIEEGEIRNLEKEDVEVKDLVKKVLVNEEAISEKLSELEKGN